jgi:hypothetical protein
LAKSKDGKKFLRVQSTPILDRNKEGLKIRAIHSVLKIKKKFFFFISEGNNFKFIKKKLYPCYDTKLFECNNLNFSNNVNSKIIIKRKKNEYRLGRPSAFKFKGKLHLFFTYDTLKKNYSYGYAIHERGKFRRNDKKFFISKSDTKEDSEMICYPRFFSLKKNFVIYSGNGMGKTGLFLTEVKTLL